MIDVQGLTKTYGDAQARAVADVSFQVPTGTILTLLGPSGCGKTTSLRCVAGLEKPTAGEISLFGETVYSASRNIFVRPGDRQVGMIFQSYAIWPHMTVFQNVAYPLTGRGLTRSEVRARAYQAIKMVSLEGLEDRPAPRLSGGQQQRVALARAIAGNPRILLLDEPLSNLDAKLREEMRGQIRSLQRKLGMTSLYVTHDQLEALSISDSIAIMSGGTLIEIGTPRDVYLRPRSLFAAQFVGLTNVLPAKWIGREGPGLARLESPLGPLLCRHEEAAGFSAGARVIALIRPESLLLSVTPHDSGINVWTGRVASTTFLGDYLDCRIACGESIMRARANPITPLEDGAEIHLHVPPERCSIIAGGA
ncbi:MAG TPA: ABC transporter ATP-binding protein [Xanthobacteraceae bacterium]|nr:ABC transporter ATP-binding protein [Xanthobacteraceae bacterium]